MLWVHRMITFLWAAADRADNETMILTTEDDPDGWAVVVDGENI